MKTNKLPWLQLSDSQQVSRKHSSYLDADYIEQDNDLYGASNDASYNKESQKIIQVHNDSDYGYLNESVECEKIASRADDLSIDGDASVVNHGYKKPSQSIQSNNAYDIGHSKAVKNSQIILNTNKPNIVINTSDNDYANNTTDKLMINSHHIPERVFMNSLVKHTFIALAIIIPLAVFSAYATAAPVVTANTAQSSLSIAPSAIIYNNASVPTTVDSVDLAQYAGTWYEIGRLPMYFQRNCARDVTATYTDKTDGSGIIVSNKCTDADGMIINADGLAKPADNTGSKLKVTFLPSWIRWLPVGRADYWVLARDDNYQSALVGTPDKDYLWLLARSPNISQQTYAKYRQIAQQQGYDLQAFKLTPQSNQTVTLVP